MELDCVWNLISIWPLRFYHFVYMFSECKRTEQGSETSTERWIQGNLKCKWSMMVKNVDGFEDSNILYSHFARVLAKFVRGSGRQKKKKNHIVSS